LEILILLEGKEIAVFKQTCKRLKEITEDENLPKRNISYNIYLINTSASKISQLMCQDTQFFKALKHKYFEGEHYAKGILHGSVWSYLNFVAKSKHLEPDEIKLVKAIILR
jgi:hypothetical protein